MRKVRKCMKVIVELDSTENILIGISSIIQRTDKEFSYEIKETNIKLKKCCLGKGFFFVDNDKVNEFCLNNSKLNPNKKRIQRLAKSIFSSLDNIWYATTHSIGFNIIYRQLSVSTSIAKELKDYININSIRNKLSGLQQVICDSVDILLL